MPVKKRTSIKNSMRSLKRLIAKVTDRERDGERETERVGARTTRFRHNVSRRQEQNLQG